MNDITKLKKELDEKIHNIFNDNKAYLDYLIQTKNNFLYRYLETSTDKNIQIQSLDSSTLIARSYEANMGEAFKTNDNEIKEGVKHLAKSIPREAKPSVQYSLKTAILDIRGEKGKIEITSEVNWDFPEFSDQSKNRKIKKILFSYDDPNQFRKELALNYEEACTLFN